MSDTNLCEHGNYHCMICEVKLLKLVIAEQAEEIKVLRDQRDKVLVELVNTVAKLGEETA